MLGLILTFLFLTSDTIYLFYSPSCPHCQDVIKSIKNTQIKDPIRLLNIEEDSNMQMLVSLENKLGIHQEDLPVFYYKNKLYYKTFPGLEEKNEKHVPLKQVSLPSPVECERCEKPESVPLEDKRIIKKPLIRGKVYYVYIPGCKKCIVFSKKIAAFRKKTGIYIEEISYFDSLGLGIVNFLKKKKEDAKPPFLLIGDTVLYDLPEDENTLLSIIKHHTKKNFHVEPHIESENLKLTLSATVIAALIDGVNPCAFTAILFLIAFLSYKQKKRRESVLVLLFFSAGIFIAYFSIGIGLFGLLEFINRFTLVRLLLRGIIGTFAIVLGIISFKDGLSLLKGEKNVKLALSVKEKQKTHLIIRKYIDKGIFTGSFFMGLSISLVEFACTGQIYLPTISYISRQKGLTLVNLAFLLLYNLFFLLPLITIGVLAIFMEHKVLSNKLREKTPTIKFATAFLFFGLGILILLT